MLAKLVLAIVCLASLVAAQTAASNTIDPSTISATLRCIFFKSLYTVMWHDK
jgi:hypothetical protein